MITESSKNRHRVAFLIPSTKYGAYWLPILTELSQYFKQVVCYTGELPNGFDPMASGASLFQVVGKTRKLNLTRVKGGYDRGFLIVSPSVISYLLRFRPQVIFTSGFSIWTLLALVLKPLGQWLVIVVYDGTSPNVDFQDSKFRMLSRQWIAKLTDKFISNSQDGERYLTEVIGVDKTNVYTRPYLVPDTRSISQCADDSNLVQLKNLYHPVFLFVGQVVHRKGLYLLISACALLEKQGYNHYTLLVVGDGAQKQEFELFCDAHGLSDRIYWAGWVDYGRLSAYFKAADVFIFPTLEDVWGMVVLEAMAFHKPVICSKWAGVAEMIDQDKTGYIIDPHNVEELAGSMRHFIEHPELIPIMGEQACQVIGQHTPEVAAKFLSNVALTAFNSDIEKISG